MTGEGAGREPGGWELLRRLDSIDKRLDDLGKGFVSVTVHNLLADDVKELRQEVVVLRADNAADVDKAKTDAAAQIALVRTELDNAKKTRAQTWTAIGLLFAGGVVTLFYDVFTRGLGMS